MTEAMTPPPTAPAEPPAHYRKNRLGVRYDPETGALYAPDVEAYEQRTRRTYKTGRAPQ